MNRLSFQLFTLILVHKLKLFAILLLKFEKMSILLPVQGLKILLYPENAGLNKTVSNYFV